MQYLWCLLEQNAICIEYRTNERLTGRGSVAATDRCIPLCHLLDTPSKQQVHRSRLIKNSKKLNSCLNFCDLVFETESDVSHTGGKLSI